MYTWTLDSVNLLQSSVTHMVSVKPMVSLFKARMTRTFLGDELSTVRLLRQSIAESDVAETNLWKVRGECGDDVSMTSSQAFAYRELSKSPIVTHEVKWSYFNVMKGLFKSGGDHSPMVLKLRESLQHDVTAEQVGG